MYNFSQWVYTQDGPKWQWQQLTFPTILLFKYKLHVYDVILKNKILE